MDIGDGITISQSMLNSVGISIFGTTMAFAVAWFWYTKGVAQDKAKAIAIEHEKLQARVIELEAKERVSGQAIMPIITAFQSLLIKQLTHSAMPEMDALLVKLGPPNILTDEEHQRLIILLEERTTDMGPEITQLERDVASILPTIIPMAAEEQNNFKIMHNSQDLKLITIVSVVGTHEEDPRKTADKKLQLEAETKLNDNSAIPT